MAVPNALVIVILSLPRWYKSLFSDLVKSGIFGAIVDCYVADCCPMFALVEIYFLDSIYTAVVLLY